MKVEVAYAERHQQWLLMVDLPEGSTVADAVQRSGMLDKAPHLDFETLKVGIFGKATKMDRVLRDGDRVEIYRPLIADPKQVRAERAKAGKTRKTDSEPVES